MTPGDSADDPQRVFIHETFPTSTIGYIPVANFLKHPATETALRWLLGLTFVYSSLHKIAAPADFAKIVYGYLLFPDAAINLIAIMVPYFELVTGTALLLGVYPRAAVLITLVMLAGFMLAISINLIRGVEFDCGCFSTTGDNRSASVWQTLMPDILLFMMGLQVLFYKGRRKWCVLQTGSLLSNRSDEMGF